MRVADKSMRKQYLMYPKQVHKLAILAKKQKKSAAAIVRKAIDAFNPDMPVDMKESELFDLVSVRLKEATADVHKTRSRLKKTLENLTVEDE